MAEPGGLSEVATTVKHVSFTPIPGFVLLHVITKERNWKGNFKWVNLLGLIMARKNFD